MDSEGLQVHTPGQALKHPQPEKEQMSTFTAFPRDSTPKERDWFPKTEEARGSNFPPATSEPLYATRTEPSRICGLRKTTFWLVFALIALLVIAAAAGGAAGGVLANKNKKSTTNPSTSPQTQTTTAVSTISTTSTVAPSGTTPAMTPSTSTSAAPPATTTVDGMTLGPWAYQGCWTDNADGDRTLNGNSTHNSGMTNELCAGYCNGWTYFGTEQREFPWLSPFHFHLCTVSSGWTEMNCFATERT